MLGKTETPSATRGAFSCVDDTVIRHYDDQSGSSERVSVSRIVSDSLDEVVEFFALKYVGCIQQEPRSALKG